MKRNFLCLFLCSFLAFNCIKTPVIEASDAVVGDWIHYTSETEAHRINISEDGTGNIESFVVMKRHEQLRFANGIWMTMSSHSVK